MDGVARFASLLPFKEEAQRLLMVHCDTVAVLKRRAAAPDAQPPAHYVTLLKRCTANAQYPVTELHLELPLDPSTFQALRATLSGPTSVRHLAVTNSSGVWREQLPGILECFANAGNALDSLRFRGDESWVRAGDLPMLCAARTRLELGVRYTLGTMPCFAAAARHLSHLELLPPISAERVEVDWQQLLAGNSALCVLNVSGCDELWDAVKRNQSLLRLSAEPVSPFLLLTAASHLCVV